MTQIHRRPGWQLAASTDTMRAAVVTEFGAPLQISDLDLPTPGYGEALVKLETSGVCHTDLHAAHGDWPVKPQPPFIPGHEGYGTVVALGDGVDDLEVGDKVGNAWLWSACGTCEYCRTGWETLCESQKERRLQRQRQLRQLHAGQRRIRRADPGQRRPVGDRADSVRRRDGLQGAKGDRHPPGPMGGDLRHRRPRPHRRAVRPRHGAAGGGRRHRRLQARAGHPSRRGGRGQRPHSDVVAEVQKATGGVHGVLVTAVHPQAFGQAIGLARRGGTIVFNGLPPGDFPAPIFDIVLKGLTIRGSIVGTRQDMAEALDFYARGLIHPTVASASLDDINEVFGRMERGQIDGRIVIDYRQR